MVFSSSKYYEPFWQKFLAEPKGHNQSALDESSIHSCESASPSSSAWVIRKKYVELVRHAKPCIHNSESYMFLWVVLFSCILALVYQLIVKSMRAFIHRCLLLLWSVKPFYSRMTRRNKLQYLIHTQDWVLAVVLRRSKY